MSLLILIVDDSHVIRAQLRKAFEAKGARVIEAANGSEGLWRARENSVSAIVADVHMPIMDGLQMIQQIRKLPEHADTPIFVLTTDAASMRADEGKRAGATAWVVKPVMPELLWKGIEKLAFRATPATSVKDDGRIQSGSDK